jgi:chromosome segregation ATPase
MSMPAFDEMLRLEERIQNLETELARSRDLVRQCSRRLLDTKADIQKIEKNLESLNIHYRELMKAPVVLLSEYEQVLKLLSDNRALLSSKRIDAAKFLKQGRETQALLPGLEAQIRQTEKELEGYGQVIPFRHEPS